ncbi:uncharacterized protein LAESUDRAFT_645250 [Laetiporus sulphureus 93-53]|uniref:BTB domain-containing protein n=1 Tax=Laetiporus sulphureus 93-53 TaxID=1314785 RepID=A0A165G7E5_9APHY|nr:uncharacterized protein LAESUDRAFT_645250 [Laetiporus sulphureus 93-53]KZT09932.1 hypothetical protein LAESUDRAFT_645250 [Laetiporus sulphureus 93-53]
MPAAPSRDQDFWLADGNVVLLAGDHAFRVHQSILCRRSDVFHNLFRVPQPEGGEMIDGCPVVCLSDSRHDVRCLLKALYDGSSFPDPQTRWEFWTLAALIRMGHKYEMAAICASALDCMKTGFPEDLDAWLDVCASGLESERMTFEAEHAIVAIRLARLTQTDSMLPAAFYLCCQLDSRHLIDGVTDIDGVKHVLDPEDLARCIDGRAQLQGNVNALAARILKPKADAMCSKRDTCRGEMQMVRDRLLYEGMSSCNVFSPPWEESVNDMCSRICNLCAANIRKRRRTFERRVWSLVPNMIGLIKDDSNR